MIPAWVAEMDYALAPDSRRGGRCVGRGRPATRGSTSAVSSATAYAGFAERHFGQGSTRGHVSRSVDVTRASGSCSTCCPSRADGDAAARLPPHLARSPRSPAASGSTWSSDPDAERAELDLDQLDALFADGRPHLLLSQPHNPWGRVFTRGELEGVRDAWSAARRPGDHRRDPRAAGAPGAEHVPYLSLEGTADHTSSPSPVEGVQHRGPALRPARGARPGRPRAAARRPSRRSTTVVAARCGGRGGGIHQGDEWLAALVERLDAQRSCSPSCSPTHSRSPDAPAGGDVPRAGSTCAPTAGRPGRRRAQPGPVRVAPGHDYQPGLEGHVRLNIATSPERLTAIVHRLAARWCSTPPRVLPVNITVIGCGYLGATHAACMAELGHEVLGRGDRPRQARDAARGQVPFYEPGLEELLAEHVESGRLRFTDSYEEAAAFGELHFVCVGTPQLAATAWAPTSARSTHAVEHAGATPDPARAASSASRPSRSAPPPRLAARLAGAGARPGAGRRAGLEPRVPARGLRGRGHAAARPARVRRAVGARPRSGCASSTRRSLDTGSPVVVTDYATAELVKVSANAFLATKISFINAVAEVCEVAGADVVALADAIGHDARIGRKFLNAGIGFGGGCLPKDIRAFVHRAGELGVEDTMTFLPPRSTTSTSASGSGSSRSPPRWSAARSRGARIAVWGAAFKPDSDDVRDSPALCDRRPAAPARRPGHGLRPEGRGHRAAAFPTLDLRRPTPSRPAPDADLVLHLTEWPEFRERRPRRGSATSWPAAAARRPQRRSTSPPGAPPAGTARGLGRR